MRTTRIARPTSALRPRQLRPLAALLVAIGLNGAGWAQTLQQPQPVVLAKAVESELVDRVEALGTLRASEQVTVTAQVTETITELRFEDGQRVSKGDTLALMTNAEESAQLLEAEAAVREAREQLDRAEPLARRGVSSEAELSERRRNHDAAKARLEAAKSRLADRRIEAPFSGLLGLRRISVGALVEPGTVITTIDDDGVMKLDFTIAATFLSGIKIGLPIEARSEAYADRVFAGEVTGIDSRIDPSTRSVTVRAIIPNEQGLLRSGLLMTLEVLSNRRQAIVIPEQAVIAVGRKTHVLVVDPSSTNPVATGREIAIGARSSGKVEVLSGLAAGEHVVTDGTLRVRDGQPVSVAAVDRGSEPLTDLLKAKSADGS